MLALTLAVPAFALEESDVEAAVSSSSREAVAGNVLVWFLCAVGFLKVSQKIDSFMASIGVNVGHTGGSMLGEAMVAFKGVSLAAGTVGKAVGGFTDKARAGGKTTSGSSGFLQGGLAGVVSRKITNDAVRTATQTTQKASSSTASAAYQATKRTVNAERQAASVVHQSKQTNAARTAQSTAHQQTVSSLHRESQHSVGLGGRLFANSLLEGGRFANDVIGMVAAGDLHSTGSITGEFASQALSSYMGITAQGDAAPQISYSDIEIGGGRITGTEYSPEHPEGISFGMYHTGQYAAPDGEHQKVFSADGVQWYKQYAADTVIKTPFTAPDGEIDYHRIVQECMRIVLEPILEAQFFAHSYGFRPMRDAAMALERVDIIMHNTGNYWIVEGDISKCFDRIDHSILIKRLYHMGIKDRRVLQIIKAMLKAGVMEECAVNEEGTPQGGLISPLLANVYLDIMDEWVSKQWENKRTRHQYVQDQSRYAVMRKKTTLVPGYLVRYADDFIIATDTRAHAEDWKARLQSFLQEKMKLTLSQEKTLITDIRKKYIKFLGYEFKMVRGKSRRGYIPRTIPDRERLKRRADKIAEDIKKIPGNYSREQMVGAINRINSQIRGIIQYYQCCTWVNIAMQKHSRKLQLAARRRLKQYNGKWIPANQTRNLPRVHQQYKQKIPSIKYRDIYVGFTALTFCRWERTPPKNQAETPYTDTGRQLYFERTKKKKMQARLDEMYSDRSARAISYGKWGKFNNFEFIMNRAYALNRDKLRCRVCGGWLIANTPWAHRINPYLPLDKVNRVNNLISLHKKCFIAVNNPNQDISEFDVKAQKKIVGYRDKLVISHTRNK